MKLLTNRSKLKLRDSMCHEDIAHSCYNWTRWASFLSKKVLNLCESDKANISTTSLVSRCML